MFHHNHNQNTRTHTKEARGKRRAKSKSNLPLPPPLSMNNNQVQMHCNKDHCRRPIRWNNHPIAPAPRNRRGAHHVKFLPIPIPTTNTTPIRWHSLRWSLLTSKWR